MKQVSDNDAANGGGGEVTPADHRGLVAPWKPGQSGNPKGRPKGSRNRLAEQFVADVYQDWQEHGLSALRDARASKPADYLKVIASILPRDIKISLETMTDKELSTRIDQLTESLGLKLVPVGTAASG